MPIPRHSYGKIFKNYLTRWNTDSDQYHIYVYVILYKNPKLTFPVDYRSEKNFFRFYKRIAFARISMFHVHLLGWMWKMFAKKSKNYK